jgi:hypothetical protein
VIRRCHKGAEQKGRKQNNNKKPDEQKTKQAKMQEDGEGKKGEEVSSNCPLSFWLLLSQRGCL